MCQIISVLDAYAYRPMVWDVFVERIVVPKEGGVTDEARVARALPAIRPCVAELARWLGEGPFLVEGELSLADFHAFPMLAYFAQTPEGSEMCASSPGLVRWMERMSKRPSVARTRSVYG